VAGAGEAGFRPVQYTARPHSALGAERVTRHKQATPDFEAALAELEAIVQRLERGELPLEESLRQFERGVALTRSCQKALRQAEQKIRVLGKDSDGEIVEQDFDAPDAD
jgi:exodeoxyribonuclease VII small subunit